MQLKHFLLILGLFVYSFSSPAFAFGEKAHRALTLTTEQLLTEKTKAGITELLGNETLEEASVWADRMRYSNNGSEFWSYQHSSNWHFVNIAPGKSYSRWNAAPEGDAYQAIVGLTQHLKGERITYRSIRSGFNTYNKEFSDDIFQNKKYALKFLVHFIQDLHQPMHVGYEHDRGGNDVSINWEGRNINLHSLWDTHLLSNSLKNEADYSENLLKKINRLSLSEQETIINTNPEQWLNEALELRNIVYESLPLARSNNSAYRVQYTVILEEQLLKASLRLAFQLNSIFDPGNQ